MSKAQALKAKPAAERKSGEGKLRGVPVDLESAVANLHVSPDGNLAVVSYVIKTHYLVTMDEGGMYDDTLHRVTEIASHEYERRWGVSKVVVWKLWHAISLTR